MQAINYWTRVPGMSVCSRKKHDNMSDKRPLSVCDYHR